MNYRIVSVDYHENLDRQSLESALYAVTLPPMVTAVGTGNYGFEKEASMAVDIRGSSVGQGDALQEERELQADDDDIPKRMLVTLWIVSANQVFTKKTKVNISISIDSNPGNPASVPATYNGPVTFDKNGKGTLSIVIRRKELLNSAGDGLCDGCEPMATAGLCLIGDCHNYNMAATNEQLTVASTVSASNVTATPK